MVILRRLRQIMSEIAYFRLNEHSFHFQGQKFNLRAYQLFRLLVIIFTVHWQAFEQCSLAKETLSMFRILS